MKHLRARTAVAGLAVAVVATLGLAGTSLAQDESPTEAPPTTEIESTEDPTEDSIDCAALFGEDFFDGEDGEFDDNFEDFELPAEVVEEINAETDALVAFLADKGVTVQVETDQDGIRFPVIDDLDDATWELVDEFFVATYGDDDDPEFFGDEDGEFEFDEGEDGDFEDFELPAEMVEEINAETDALVAFLADKGVTVEVETDQDGIRFPVIDDLDDATWELVDEFFVATYGDIDDFEFDDDFLACEELLGDFDFHGDCGDALDETNEPELEPAEAS